MSSTRRWLAFLLAVGALVAAACGVDAVGNSASPDDGEAEGGASNLPPGASSSGDMDGGVSGDENPIEVIGEPDAGPVDADVPDVDLDAGDASDGNTCTVDDGGACTNQNAATTCCSKTCNAYERCGACSSSTSTKCSRSSECCSGLFCGKDYYEPSFHCYQCQQKNAGCSIDVMCCSGKCDKGRCR